MGGVYRPTKSLFSSLFLGLLSVCSLVGSTAGELQNISHIKAV